MNTMNMIELGSTHSSVDTIHLFVVHFLYIMLTTSTVLFLLWGSHIRHGMIPVGTLYMMVRGRSQPATVLRAIESSSSDPMEYFGPAPSSTIYVYGLGLQRIE